MELRSSWQMFARHWWIPVGLAIIAALTSLLFTARTEERWLGTISLAISVPGQAPNPDLFTYNDYYTWVTSEYLIDDFSEVMKGQRFAEDLAAEAGTAIPAGTVIEGERTEKTHRVLSFSVEAANPETARELAAAAARVIENRGGEYFAQLNQRDAVVQVVDGPTVTPARPPVRTLFDAALRGILGFVLGIGIILLLEYLDPTVRSTRDLEGLLRVPVLGEIPAEAGGRRGR